MVGTSSSKLLFSQKQKKEVFSDKKTVLLIASRARIFINPYRPLFSTLYYGFRDQSNAIKKLDETRRDSSRRGFVVSGKASSAFDNELSQVRRSRKSSVSGDTWPILFPENVTLHKFIERMPRSSNS